MSSPFELRHYWRRYTYVDAQNGINPIRVAVTPQTSEAFAPPVLQYRYKEVVHEDGVKRTVWSEWCDVPMEREGVPIP